MIRDGRGGRRWGEEVMREANGAVVGIRLGWRVLLVRLRVKHVLEDEHVIVSAVGRSIVGGG